MRRILIQAKQADVILQLLFQDFWQAVRKFLDRLIEAVDAAGQRAGKRIPMVIEWSE
ncbi:hypothetical protein O5541_27355 [Escherichia coli]|nr:hypothetical protein [Escherichia coli]